MPKWLVTAAIKDAPTHVIDAPSDDILIGFARRRFGTISWWCPTDAAAIEDLQVRLDLMARERAIGTGREGAWGEWSK